MGIKLEGLVYVLATEVEISAFRISEKLILRTQYFFCITSFLKCLNMLMRLIIYLIV